jgi:predicted dinucleotide-binding enzyme
MVGDHQYTFLCVRALNGQGQDVSPCDHQGLRKPAAAEHVAGSVQRSSFHHHFIQERQARMTVGVIGTGNIGLRVARRLAEGGVDVVVASSTYAGAQQAAMAIGSGVRAAEVEDAIEASDVIVFATWFMTTKGLFAQYAPQLVGKTVVDPSNNIAPDGSGGFANLNPEGVSSGQQLAAALPLGTRFVKAFGTLGANQLDSTTTESGETAVLFYATDDDAAGNTVAELITKAGYDPVQAGGLKDTARIEVFGDLHPYGGLSGRAIARAEAVSLLQK